jgi:hypothetical protein
MCFISLPDFILNLQDREVRCSALDEKRANIMEAVKLMRNAEEVDLVFLLDATSSMHPLIAGAKESIQTVLSRLRISNPGLKLRIACVCYRDIGDSPQHIVLDFTEDAGAFSTLLHDVEAFGGADAAEDIAGALNLACGLSWTSATRLIFHIGDAPCHGTDYQTPVYIASTSRVGGNRDRFPDGDPTGICPIAKLATLKVSASLSTSSLS